MRWVIIMMSTIVRSSSDCWETIFVEAYNETGVSLAELIPGSTNVGAQVLVLRILVLIIFLAFQHFQFDHIIVMVFFWSFERFQLKISPSVPLSGGCWWHDRQCQVPCRSHTAHRSLTSKVLGTIKIMIVEIFEPHQKSPFTSVVGPSVIS